MDVWEFVERLAVMVGYAAVLGAAIVGLHFKPRWGRKAALYTMVVVSSAWVLFYAYLIVVDPATPAEWDFAATLSRIAHMLGIVAIGVIVYVIRQSELSEQEAIKELEERAGE